MKRGVLLVLGLITVIYPFLVYWGLERYGAGVFALFLLLMLIVRFVITRQYRYRGQWVLLFAMVVFCGIVLTLDSQALLRWYPVLISLGFSLLFWLSLAGPTTLIERFARLAGEQPSAQALVYMRKLTVVWAILLLLNAGVAAYTACCLSLAHWTFYNGLLSYGVFALFMALEYGYRRHYQRKYRALSE